MKNAVIVVIALIVTIGLVVIAYFFFFSAGPTTQPSPTPIGIEPPPTPTVSPSPVLTPNPTPTPTRPTISILTLSGQTLVKDFKTDPATVLDPNNQGHYHLSGGIGAAQLSAPYTIVYSDTDQSFTVALWREPLKAIRQQAEQDLLQKLGISQNIACTLRYTVLVANDVNAFYSGKNLGFSFCPGAVQLP